MKTRLKIIKIASIAVVLVLALGLIIGCTGTAEAETLTVYHAGSLAVPFEGLEEEFEASQPTVDVLREQGGSAAMISKSITLEEAGESPPDIIASADYSLIPDRLYEDGYADWYIAFARNIMVLAYRDQAPYADTIGDSRTWYDVLRNEAVSYGHSNPDDDPCGYRTPMVMQLAQKYYYEDAVEFGLTPDPIADGLYDALIPGSEHERGRVGGTSDSRPGGSEEVVRPKSVDLVALLQSGDLDYAFEYRSVAIQHNLNFIELDDAINLSQAGEIDATGITYEEFYQEASIEIISEPGPPATYKAITGKPIIYGITILNNAQNQEMAAEFILLVLSKQELDGQPCLSPPLCDYPENLPASLQAVISP
jgi:molybdate/tungstate transport system substrate-binding protein